MSQLVIPNEPIETWLAELKPFQRNALSQFLTDLEVENAAEQWLTTIGSPNIAHFGGRSAGDPKPFWEKFKRECHRFICDETAYIEDKKALSDANPVSRQILISVMSSAIGSTLG